MRAFNAIASITATMAFATPAMAASDYLLEIDGIKGEVSSIAIESWSFGACNAGQCTSVSRDAASGQATGKRGGGGVVKLTASQNSQSLRESPTRQSTKSEVTVTASQNTQSLRESPTRASNGRSGVATGAGAAAGGVAVAVGDLDGDGLADLAYAGTQDVISDFTVTFDKSTPQLATFCSTGEIDQARLRSGEDSWTIEKATVSCSIGRQTQGTSFGEKVMAGGGKAQATMGARCADGTCAAVDAPLSIRFTGGQMKHTKSGHVTLLK